GPCRVIPQEYPTLTASSIDVSLDGDPDHLAERLLLELRAARADGVVALRGRHRWVQSWESVRLDEAPSTRLRPGGVYLITGGLGGIALALAEYLAVNYRAKLVLLARTLWPERVARVRALEATGAEVLIIHADVSVPADVRAAVEQAEARFGTIDGVLHTAGV